MSVVSGPPLRTLIPMPRVVFTRNLERHVACPPQEVQGRTARAVLDAVFAANPTLRGYVIDDQGALRHHMVIFVDGKRIRDRGGLTDEVGETSEVYVSQARSGG